MAKGADTIEIFTDGACSGNPGPGGWGVLLRWRGHEKELYGGVGKTTNNRMELMAAIRGIEPETMATLTEANLARFLGA